MKIKIIHILSIAFFIIINSSCYKNEISEIYIQNDNEHDNPKNSPYQNLVFADEFNGRDAEMDKSCFDIKPVCSLRLDNGVSGDCPTDTEINNLKDLNKCNWAPFAGYGFWDKSGRSAYHPNQIKIEQKDGDGYLSLKGKWRKDKKKYNCRYDDSGPNGQYTDCLFDFGGVESKYIDEQHPGRSFKYGRVEFRARVSTHQNLYPALWTWPVGINQGNPHKFHDWNSYVVNEIDILEATNTTDGKFDAFQTLHDWKCPEGVSGTCNIWTGKSTYLLDKNKWYTFGAVRENINGINRVRFYIDNNYTLTINEGDLAHSGNTDIKKYFRIGDTPLAITLNVGSSFVNPDYSKMDGMSFDIDWVRIYE